ncbi:MAG: Site-specific DNA recombinase [Candidatus Electronema aureum]|uniref:Site-specific DNA recombinase n=1 Tax=Candidatus Electronema aureum TaxID=2005002 RepID=A0A521FY91_9BACT|nr:MAG: Site-specific DNA recombinase [Candidatus Electronema aureum]
MANGNGHNVGYVRVSSIAQNLDRQLNGIELDKVFTEKASAKDAKRPILKECMGYLREGDTLHVHSIDRLARNLVDLQNIIQELNSKNVSIQFHKENLLFTGNDNAMSKLMLNMMGAFAEFERNLIKERQMEGIKVAQEKGVKFGRNKTLTGEQILEIKDRIAKGEKKTALAKEYNVSRQTIYSAIYQGELLDNNKHG